MTSHSETKRTYLRSKDNGKPEVLIITNESEIFLIQNGDGYQGRRFLQLSEEERFRSSLAEDIFGGRFTEVRNLRHELGRVIKAEMAVITKGYGLIEGSTLISPYFGYVSTTKDIHDTEEKYGLCEKLRMMIDCHDMTVICLPKDILSFFIDHDVFSNEKTIIFITSENPATRLDEDRFIILPRRGARVGRGNAQKILQICREMVNNHFQSV